MHLLEEVKGLCGVTSDQQLAKLLHKDRSTITKWRSSGEIPAKIERDLQNLARALFEDPGELKKFHHAADVQVYFRELAERYSGREEKKQPTLEATAAEVGLQDDVIVKIFSQLSDKDQIKHLRAMLADLPALDKK